MPRYFVPISLDDFKKKFNEKFPEFDPYELGSKIDSDLKKVSFDFENYEYEGDGFATYPCGFKTLANGMPALFVTAGGDWEYPVCFVIYWDGTNFRAYIPQAGNVWGRLDKAAFGSCEDKGDEANVRAFLKEALSWDHKASQRLENLDPDDIDSAVSGLENEKAIFDDIMERIQEKK